MVNDIKQMCQGRLLGLGLAKVHRVNRDYGWW